MTRLRRIEEHAPIPQANPPGRKKPLRRRLLRWSLLAAVLLGSGTLLWFFHGRVVAAGIVEGEVFTFTAPASVVVEELYVEPGQWCAKAQPLVRLAARDAEAQRRVFETQLSQARSRLELVKHGAELEDLQLARRLDDRDRLAADMAAAEAAVAGAQARFDRAQRELTVYAGLRDQHNSSPRELDAAETEAATAHAELTRAHANLAGLRARSKRQHELVPTGSTGTELRRLELALLEDGVREAEQRLHRFDFQSGTRTILAPFSGWVDRVYVRSASHREEGEPLLSMHDPASLYVTAYLRPADREGVQVGEEVRMFPSGTSQAITGVVREIHRMWARVPNSTRRGLEESEAAITMRIECDDTHRALLAPGMVLKVVIRGR